jgi:hypothetical protein
MAVIRTYEFRLRVEVDEDHIGFDDPEWIADAAWGALTNLYGLRCTYGPTSPVTERTGSEPGA